MAAFVLGIPEHKVRVIAPDVGGAFGSKIFLYNEETICSWATRKLKRPVRWTSTRREAFQTDAHGRDHVTEAEMGFTREGKIVGLRVKTLANLGAYLSTFAPAVPTYLYATLLNGVYEMPAIHADVTGVFTNTVPVDAYRGAGRPEAAYFMERLIEHAANVTGIDRAEIRRRNLIPENKLPYTTPTHWVYDSGEFVRLMDLCMANSDWKGYAARQRESKKHGKLRGRSVAFYIEFGGIFNDRMDMKFDPSGSLTIYGGTHSHGQGHATVFAQLAHELLGVPFEQIRYVQGDTAQVAIGRGTYGARSMVVGGNALKFAADQMIEKGKKIAAAMLEADADDLEFKDGGFRVTGTDKVIGLVDVAKATYAPMGPIAGKFGIGLDATGSFDPTPPSHPNGAHVVELEVDPDTGAVHVDRYYVVDDLGRIINPMIVKGQQMGGVVQGIGQALMEHQVYDRDSGQLITGSFMDYAMPRAAVMPNVECALEEVPCKTNPLGVKGIGESGTIGAPPAVINAVIDALRPLGVDAIDMPATPLRVWEAIERAKAKGGVAA
jgi:carbon-monoxide dehydrogenase large subunit